MPRLVMPEGRKIRKRSDYIFRLSGISCRKPPLPSRHEPPLNKLRAAMVFDLSYPSCPRRPPVMPAATGEIA